MPEWDNDERLAKQYFYSSEARAFEILFRRHVGATYGFMTRFLASREDAEEATSEAWLRAVRALREGRFHGESRFKTWLFGIARHVCLERLRQPRLPTLSLTGFAETGHGDWVLFAAAPEAETALDRALAAISDDHRLILTLCDLQGFTASEAAQIMDRTSMAAKSLHGRARRALRDALLQEQKRESEEE